MRFLTNTMVCFAADRARLHSVVESYQSLKVVFTASVIGDKHKGTVVKNLASCVLGRATLRDSSTLT